MIPQRYRKPLLAAAVAIVLYAILGFFLAPWLVEKTARSAVRDNLGVELALQDVSVNPFALSLQIDGLELDEPDGKPFVTVERIYINFQLSSLFRWALTFREFYIESPRVRLARDGAGNFNFDFLAQPSAQAPEPEPATESGPPRLLIQDFAITDSVVDWKDEVPPEPVDTHFGPINIAISELNTLPDRAGSQDVVITTESQGTFSWNGSLELNPLRSEGSASIKGSHFPLTSAYLKHEIGFEVDEGSVDVELDYHVDTRPDGSLEASVSNLEMSISDLLVLTFNEALGRTGPDREVLTLPAVRLWGGEFRWPERTVTAAGFSIDDGVIALLRDADGALNVLPAEDDEAAEKEDESQAEAETGAASDEPWRVSLSEFSINRLALNMEDQSLDPSANIGWKSLDIDVRNISNEPSAVFPTTVRLEALDGGSISVEGGMTVLPDPSFDFDLLVDALEFGMVDPYVKQLADVHLESGALNVEAELHSSAEEPLRVSGNVEIVDFLLTESDQDARLGSWTSFRAENLMYTTAGNKLEISELRFAQPYADILIAEDGSINLGRVRKGDDDSDETVEEPPVADAAPEEPGTDITIGRVVVGDAAADFADLSLPLPFRAQIAALNGEISTIATTSSEPSTVKMEGNVDEFGRVQVSGTVTPLDPAANTDIRVAFENVDMPKFSAYSIPFAGQEIASGRLDLDLGYTIKEGALTGENNVVLRDFELGEKVEHPGAMSLPLGLAVALLKDADGRIDLDVPVRGDLNDPEFKYGAVVGKALVNLLTKIVTSPFALLGKLVGAEAGELEYIAFEPGRADLSPPEREKAGKIAEALQLRPQLVLQIGGVYAPGADAAAMKAERVDAAIEERIAAAKDDKAMYAEQRFDAVEQLLTEALADADPGAKLDEAREAHTSLNDDGKEQFDALAYTEALRGQLIELQSLGEDELVSFGATRVENVRQAIVAVNAELDARIVIDAPAAVGVDDEIVRMKLRLSSR